MKGQNTMKNKIVERIMSGMYRFLTGHVKIGRITNNNIRMQSWSRKKPKMAGPRGLYARAS